MKTKLGSELRAGDVISVWWRPGRDKITNLRPYDGTLIRLFAGGAQIAEFALSRVGMTIDNDFEYEVIE